MKIQSCDRCGSVVRPPARLDRVFASELGRDDLFVGELWSKDFCDDCFCEGPWAELVKPTHEPVS